MVAEKEVAGKEAASGKGNWVIVATTASATSFAVKAPVAWDTGCGVIE